MVILAIIGLVGLVTGIVCVNRARTPDGANYGMLLAGVGFVLLIVTGIIWLL